MPSSGGGGGTRPEHMLPIMIVLGIMFVGICIAMNLFSRARFKKRANVFVAGGRATPQRRSMGAHNQLAGSSSSTNYAQHANHNKGVAPGGASPGSAQRRESAYCPTPTPSTTAAAATTTAKSQQQHQQHQPNHSLVTSCHQADMGAKNSHSSSSSRPATTTTFGHSPHTQIGQRSSSATGTGTGARRSSTLLRQNTLTLNGGARK